jgi:hypothetical protein
MIHQNPQSHPAGRTVHGLGPDGCVRDLLVTSVVSVPVDDLDRVVAPEGDPWASPDGRLPRWRLTNGPDATPIKQRLYQLHPLPVDPAPAPAVEGGRALWPLPLGGWADRTWAREHCPDGLADFSEFCPTPRYRFALAACALETDQGEWRDIEIASTGPAAVWIGGRLAVTTDVFSYMEPQRMTTRIWLEPGTTPIVAATWQVAFRECRHVVGFRVGGLPVHVVLASPGADQAESRDAEVALDSVGLASWATDGTAELTGPPGLRLHVGVDTIRIHGTGGAQAADSSADLHGTLDGTGRLRVPLPAISHEGRAVPYQAVLTVRVDSPGCPVLRRFPVANLAGTTYRARPSGAAADWRGELFRYAAAQPPSLARVIAVHAAGGDVTVGEADVARSLALVHARGDCADFDAVGLLVARRRIPAERWGPGVGQAVDDALIGFKYWIDQPGLDAMCYFTENHQLVWHAAETLAGETFPEARFPNTGWTGAQHAAHGAAMAAAWIARKLAGGFSEFDSNAYMAINCLSLAALADLAADPSLRAAAEAALDWLLVTLACGSFRGIHGSAHGRSYVGMLRSARLEETGPIMWSQWGAGSLNPAVLPAVVLAASGHPAPDVAGAIAGFCDSRQGRVWDGFQRNRGRYAFDLDLLDRPWASEVRVHRTADAMISSVQDYRAGLPGLQEHVWGITLGPETEVFATHPAAGPLAREARPDAWAGQRILPRVRQHKGTIFAVHRIPSADPHPRTHLWFPAVHFDETRSRGPWLAGRLGNAYAAVATQGGFRPTTAGPDAGAEWWPAGPGWWYVAYVASTAEFPALADLLDALAEPRFACDRPGEPAIAWTTPDGDDLELSFSGPFLVNGQPEPLNPARRIENPAIRLNFGQSPADFRLGGQCTVINLLGSAGNDLGPARRGDALRSDTGPAPRPAVRKEPS